MADNAISSNEEKKEALENTMFLVGDGNAKLSVSNADVSAGLRLSSAGVILTEIKGAIGMALHEGAVFIQGLIRHTSKGENIVKGEYSENPRSAKIFTYKETIVPESIPKDVAAQAAGVAGINLSVGVDGTTTSVGMDGMSPLITDFGIGQIEPHLHTIVTQHVHRIEPVYLYRVPSLVGMVTGAMDNLKQFFAA